MATTKVPTNLLNTTLSSGGAEYDTPSSVATINDGYGGCLFVLVSNGVTGPSAGVKWKIQVSGDNSNWYDFGGPCIAGTDSSTDYGWGGIEIPIGVAYLKVLAGNTGDQNVDIRVDIVEVTEVR